MNMRRYFQFLFFTFLIALMALSAYGQNSAKKYGVYEYVIESAQGTFEEAAAALEGSMASSEWHSLAKVDAGVPEECPYKSRVYVFFNPPYAQQIMTANRKTGPYAVLDRINVFEDENGLHVALVNPHSINRTILMDDQKYETMTALHLQDLQQLINRAVHGTSGHKQFGLTKAGPKEGVHLVYKLELPEYETVIFGTTGTPMDSQSFSIVRSGSDESRDDLKCPGLARAAAYPIEVVVAKDDSDVKIRLVDMMYRMKMYFEDAGKRPFMKKNEDASVDRG